jgi:flagellar biosynthetic protein FliQ
MTPEAVLRILREGLLLVVILSAVPMLASMIVGLTISILQATTQIQEQTLSFVPKLIAVFIAIGLLGPWMLQQTVRFSVTLLETIPMVR